MKDIGWDDLQIFAAVGHGGGLTAAARALGTSPPTVGRRMLALEERLGRRLFDRRQSGYALTADGAALLERVKAMEAGARRVVEWGAAADALPVVRISAGTWTASFLAENFARIWTRDDPFRIAFATTEARLDIAHREVDIGLRNARPDSPNLAARRTAEVAFACFRARNRPPEWEDAWVAIPPENATTHSARWANRSIDGPVAAWANTPRTLYELIRAGVGKGVLPCFAGDRDPAIERVGPPIGELNEEQWLVMHNDDRQRPEIRAVIDRIAALAAAHSSLFAGRRPFGD